MPEIESPDIEELLQQLRITSSDGSTLLKDILELIGREWSVALDSPVFRAYHILLEKRVPLESNLCLGMVEYTNFVCRNFNHTYPPQQDDKLAWGCFCILSFANYSLGFHERAFQNASLVLKYCPEYSELLEFVLEDPLYAPWANTVLGHYDWESSESGTLKLQLPVLDGFEVFEHEIASSFSFGDVFTLTPDKKGGSRAFPNHHIVVSYEDTVRLANRLNCSPKSLTGMSWQSPVKNHAKALSYLLVQLRSSDIERLHEKFANGVLHLFSDSENHLLFEEDDETLWFSQSVVGMSNGGILKVNPSWWSAFSQAFSETSRASGKTIQCKLLVENAFEVSSLVLAFSDNARTFHVAITCNGEVFVEQGI